MTVDNASTVVAHRPLANPLEAATVEQLSQRSLAHAEAGFAGHFRRAAGTGPARRAGTSISRPRGRDRAMRRRREKDGGKLAAAPLAWRTLENGNGSR